jgi:hypothetical protein
MWKDIFPSLPIPYSLLPISLALIARRITATLRAHAFQFRSKSTCYQGEEFQ